MSYEDTLKIKHKERLYLALVLIVLFGTIAFIDKYFNLGIVE